MQISCLYCHFGAESSRHAGIPPASVCMTCHRFVTAPQKDMLAGNPRGSQSKASTPARSFRRNCKNSTMPWDLDSKLEPDPNKKPKPIAWVKVHNLPAFTCFDHRSHVRAGVACQQLPWSGRDHGARAAGLRPVDGVVRQLPPGNRPDRRGRQASQAVHRLCHVSSLTGSERMSFHDEVRWERRTSDDGHRFSVAWHWSECGAGEARRLRAGAIS